MRKRGGGGGGDSKLAQQSETKIISLTIMNSITPKAVAEH
jgi:hypothetical protein